MQNNNTLMGNYEDVNKEIQEFLTSKNSNVFRKQESPKNYFKEETEILPLLESLCSTYNEINSYLKTENAEALKDVILKSDVKMSLVCETLLETLRRTTESKKKLSEDYNFVSKEKRELEEKDAKNRVMISKLESDLGIKQSNLNELQRIIKDQKDKISEYKSEAMKAKSDSNLNKVKVEELENLRSKAFERIKVYEQEIEAVSSILKEKEENIKTLIQEKKVEENKNSNVKTKVLEMERMIEILNKKLDGKEKSLSLCNLELSKIINENKIMRNDFDKYKESSSYYEGLYKNVNKQNVYLNGELNKMIKSGEYNKDGIAFINKYKKKARKYKKTFKKLEEENKKLKKEVSGIKNSTKPNDTVVTDTSDSLIKHIEELTTKNKEYRARIATLENSKNEIERKIAFLERESKKSSTELQRKEDKVDLKNNSERFIKTGLSNRDNILPSYLKPDNRSEIGVFSHRNRLEPDRRSEYLTRNMDYMNETKPFREMFSSPSFIKPIMSELKGNEMEEYPNKNYMKMFNLANEYENLDANEFHGGFINKDISSVLDHYYNIPGNLKDIPIEKPLTLNTNNQVEKVEENLFKGKSGIGSNISVLFENTEPVSNSTKTKNTVKKEKLPKPIKKTMSTTNPFEDEPSVESVKTYHTTSTLKDMIARTDQLQQKFENLEEQLANIKDGNTEEKLSTKIKTYNNNYSDLNIDSNDSDFI